MIEESDKDGSGSMDFLVGITVIEFLDQVDFTTSRVLYGFYMYFSPIFSPCVGCALLLTLLRTPSPLLHLTLN